MQQDESRADFRNQSLYARDNSVDDFAESTAEYAMDKTRFKHRFPKLARIIKSLLEQSRDLMGNIDLLKHQ